MAAHNDIGEASKEPAMLRQSMSAIPPERAMERLAGIDDNDRDGAPTKRLREDINDYSRATSTTTQLSKKPKLAKSPKRRSDDDNDGLEQSSLKRRRSNRITFGSATNTDTNDPSLPNFMQLPNFTKATKRRASTYDETEIQTSTAKRQKLTTHPDREINVSMTQQLEPDTLSGAMDGDVNDNNYFKKSSLRRQSMDTATHKGTKKTNETLQTLKRRSQKQARTMDNDQAQKPTAIAEAPSPGEKTIIKTNQVLGVQGRKRVFDVFQDGDSHVERTERSETAGKVRRLALDRDNERAPLQKGQTQLAAPGSSDHATKSSLTTASVKPVEKRSPRFVARRRNIAKAPSTKCKSSKSYSKPATEGSVIAEPGDLEKTQSHTDTSSYTTTARGQGIPGEISIKAPISLTNTPRIIGMKRRYQDAPAGGHGKRQRVNSEQSETVPPKPFLERLPREVRDMIYAELLGQGRKAYCLNHVRAEELRMEQIETPVRVQESIDELQFLIDELQNYLPCTFLEADIRDYKSEIDLYLSGRLGVPTIKFIDTAILTTSHQFYAEGLHSLLSKNAIHLVPELEIGSLRSRDCMDSYSGYHYEQFIKFDDAVERALLTARDISMRMTVDMVPPLVRILKQRHSNETPILRSLSLRHTWHEFSSHDDFNDHLYPLRTIRAQEFSFKLCQLRKSQDYQIQTFDNSRDDPLPERLTLSSATKESIKQLKLCVERTGPTPQSEPFCTRNLS